MKSVLFLIPTLDRGGAENVLVNLVNHLDQSQFRITVQTLFDENSQKDLLREGIEYRSFLYHQFHGNSRLMACIPASVLYRLIVRKRYDIVVSYLEGPTAHIASGCPYEETKLVAWVHGEMETSRQWSVGFCSHAAAYKGYQRFDRLVFVATPVKNSFERIAAKQYENGIVLYNTLETDDIRRKALEPISERLYQGNEFHIVSVGKIASVKGFDRLARVQKRLKDMGYPTHIYILGQGRDRKTIEAYTKENGIADSFSFLGFQENPYKYVAGADLFVCSSRREGFSTAVSEALVLGVPVISTNCSGAYELLGENNEFGLVVENDEEALYQGIKSLLDDPALLEYYRRQASKRGERFSTESTVKAVEDMLLELF